MLWCLYAGSSLEVKIETDSNDAMEIKTEADSNDITEYSHDDRTSTGMFGFYRAAYMQVVFPIAKVYVCPSVCHSVNCDKMNESSAEILITHER